MSFCFIFFFQAEDGIRDAQESRGLGDVYKRQVSTQSTGEISLYEMERQHGESDSDMETLDAHQVDLLLPRILRSACGGDWRLARQHLLTEFDLDVEEDDVCFAVSYKLQSKLWAGTPEQRMVLAQSRGTIYAKPTPEVPYDELYRCVCLPFVKFWSVGEAHAEPIPEPFNEGVEVLEKLDGTITKLFYHAGRWRLASNSKLSTDEPRAKRGGQSTMQAFVRALERAGLTLEALFERLCCRTTYFFELLDPSSVIVVPVPDYRLVHIGSRDMNTLHEVDCDIGISKPRAHALMSMKECVEAAASIPWHQGEGFVVTDRRAPGHSWRRVKVKSRSYLRVHNATTNVLANDVVGFCLDTWLNGESSEILAYFADFKAPYAAVVAALEHPGTGLADRFAGQFNMLVGEDEASPNQRRHFYERVAQVPKDGPRPLFKRLYDVYEGKVAAAQVVQLLQGEVNTNVHQFRKFLKAALLKELPAEILETQVLGIRGRHGARGAASEAEADASPHPNPNDEAEDDAR
eukprot:TRINITY_DN12963_c0_g1_i2.p1 TRINITY_DN12963_c0_g1~~TRINITY_DN12963_c0_g1_i2.p1  ORF type:complete len:519 (+),score=106.75 TRINITY_DN12963_c0_g1_i2:53-1609(+)